MLFSTTERSDLIGSAWPQREQGAVISVWWGFFSEVADITEKDISEVSEGLRGRVLGDRGGLGCSVVDMCLMGWGLGRTEIGGVEDEVGWIGKGHTTGQLEAGDARGGGIGGAGGLCRRIECVCLVMVIVMMAVFVVCEIGKRRGKVAEEGRRRLSEVFCASLVVLHFFQ